MRIDQWLSKVCLLKTRSQAKNGCRSGKILLDGGPVKESQALHGGEELTIVYPHKETRLKVLDVPAGNVSKKEAARYYEIIDEKPLDPNRPPEL